MLVSVALFSGFTSVSTVPAGSLANAASVGAKTVNGPGDASVSTRPAALTAATSVLRFGAALASSTMFLAGYIAAPPTIEWPSPLLWWLAMAGPASASVAAAGAARRLGARVLSICFSVIFPYPHGEVWIRGQLRSGFRAGCGGD